jgi:2-polyprenyl-3-methyl-5-hydroxy-6-metoxy-1,4-benzoquinol methylase
VKPLDRLLQRWRISKARPFVPPGARVLDVGCADGALFGRLGTRVGEGVGIDPDWSSPPGGLSQQPERHLHFVRGRFPDDLPDMGPFDVVTALAVLEHVPKEAQQGWAEACFRCLRPGGTAILTVPSPAVDRILAVLCALRILDGMETEEHYGFDPSATTELLQAAGVRLMVARRFQLGLNTLFVFRR